MLNENKIVWIIAVLVSAAVLIAGFAWFILGKKPASSLVSAPAGNVSSSSAAVENMKSAEPQPDPNQTKEEADVLLRRAMDGRDDSLCRQIYNATDKQYCMYAVLSTLASDAKDSSMCEQISGDAYRVACADNVIIAKARDAKNASLCSGLSDKNRITECEKLAK